MKHIILLALICSTSLAVPGPAKKLNHKSVHNPFHDKIIPALNFWNEHKSTLKSISKIHEAPGLKEVVEQAVNSTEHIYNFINRASDRLVPLIRDNDLNALLNEILPGVVQQAGYSSYEVVASSIEFLNQFLAMFGFHLSPEDVVRLFLVGGIASSVILVPFYVWDYTWDMINSMNFEAGTEFQDIFVQLLEDSLKELEVFFEVLYAALDAIEA